MPYLDFTAGQVLTADQVDQFLMRQTVMVFDDAAARTTALSAVLTEGMITYLKDSNATQYYTGSAWAAIGEDASIYNGEVGQTAISAGAAGIVFENSISPILLIGA